MEGLGEGLGALAFWGFISALVVVGVWESARKREAQHETLRRLIESGKPVDEAMMTRLMGGEVKRPDRDLTIAAIIMLSIAVGLVVLAAVLSGLVPRALLPLLGAAGLVACIAAGLWAASRYVRRAQAEDAAQTGQRPYAS